MQYQKGQILIVETSAMVPGGAAFGKLPDPSASREASGRPVFVKGGAPNEQATVRLTRIKKDFAEAEFVRAIRPSPDRVQAPFDAAALAGADWHYLSYEAQLFAKQAIVKEVLEKIGHLEHPTIEPIVPASKVWRYRNKVELTFGLDDDDQGSVALGFHKPGKFDEIFPTDDIALFPEIGKTIINYVVDWAKQEKLTAYEPRRKSGVLRNLVLRRAEHGSDFIINLVTTPVDQLPVAKLLIKLEGSTVSGVIWTKNASDATIVRSDETRLLTGKEYIDETFLGKTIRYHADSFFQTHTTMAEKLAETLLARLANHQPEIVIDGYAGVGGFGLFAAAQGAQVVSIESHPSSILDAEINAERLGVADRMKFIHQPMEEYLTLHVLPDNAALIIDPPRAGLHPTALRAIRQSTLQRIFYVSCNPATLARDVADLKFTYQPIFIQPFDLFPQTSHVETLVELQKIT